ncbi:hypothetical protein [Actinomadura verrucosospora]|uniref:DUF3592 domain-containing protein n=1 Tax=Actinomadura verrucosospora TaxID=46165 RepID=A0A7D3W498_ACTVE|nr:hypothetical protein [Actinomadura verrucosospora]QKG25831.1 hypothetical protein ACTIVE_7483 [Actinomadura verrucosospora]
MEGTDPARPGRARRWLAWTLTFALAIGTTTGLAFFDAGLGIVAGVLALVLAYWLLLRRMALGGRAVARTTRRLFAGGWALLVVGALGAAYAGMLVLGRQGTGRVDYQDEQTGTHGTRYLQCYVIKPDGTDGELRTTGACPASGGTRIAMVYLPHDSGDVARPLLGTKRRLLPRAAVWAVADLLGLAALAAAARTSGTPEAAAP